MEDARMVLTEINAQLTGQEGMTSIQSCIVAEGPGRHFAFWVGTLAALSVVHLIRSSPDREYCDPQQFWLKKEDQAFVFISQYNDGANLQLPRRSSSRRILLQ